MSAIDEPHASLPLAPPHDDDALLLDDDADGGTTDAAAAPVLGSVGRSAWTVLVVDDEPDVHTVTRLALKDFEVEGCPLRLLEARSGAEARDILLQEPDVAVVLLDVVMETDDAGLVVARWVRASLKNSLVRIVLRTGQPGVTPEETVMSTFDIHDYYGKTEITARRLRTLITSGVRAWRDLQTLHLQREEIARAQHSLVAALQEKETLLKEIHHRVKNNLQIVSSLLRLQGDRMPSQEARDLIEESVLRVQSMALIHQHLYGVDTLDRVDLGDYARVLAESLRSLLAPSVRLRVQARSASVGIHEAIPAGLILNELLTNAFKYGVPQPGSAVHRAGGGRTGPHHQVCVEVGLDENQVRLAVVDAGPGLPVGVDLQKTSSIGLHLVSLLTRQLRGTLSYDSDEGSRFVVTFARRATEKTGA
jgi:two-component sensor histidine kinase/CheY-like chemotaxis protein